MASICLLMYSCLCCSGFIGMRSCSIAKLTLVSESVLPAVGTSDVPVAERTGYTPCSHINHRGQQSLSPAALPPLITHLPVQEALTLAVLLPEQPGRSHRLR